MKKKSIILIAAIVVVIASIAIMGTLAYFTDTQTVSNTFSVGDVKIVLNEAEVERKTGSDEYTKVTELDPDTSANVEKRTETGNAYEDIYPGALIPKDPTVTMSTDSSDAYLRVSVKITKASEWTTIFANYGLKLEDIFGGYDADSWTGPVLVADTDPAVNTITYTYYYIDSTKKDRLSGGDSVVLFETITIPELLENTDLAAINGFSINVFAEAMQAEGFVDAATAWIAYDGVVNP